MASSHARFKIRNERSHRCLQSFGPIPIATVLGGLVEGFEKFGRQRHADSSNSLIIQDQIVTRLTVLLILVERAKSITNLRLYITKQRGQAETTCQYALGAVKA